MKKREQLVQGWLYLSGKQEIPSESPVIEHIPSRKLFSSRRVIERAEIFELEDEPGLKVFFTKENARIHSGHENIRTPLTDFAIRMRERFWIRNNKNTENPQ